MFSWCCRQACWYFPTKFKPRFSAKDRRVDQCIWTAESPCFGWKKVAMYRQVKARYALFFSSFFVGSLAEPKVNSWSDATLRQLFQDWLSVMWTLTFTVLFTTMDFVFFKSGVLLFFASSGYHVLLQFGLQDTLSWDVIKTSATLVKWVFRGFWLSWLLSWLEGGNTVW